MAKQQRSYGWVRQSPDPRDYLYAAPRRILTALPPVMDLSANLGPQLDQGSLGSCGPHTATAAIQYEQRVENQPLVQPSRLFIYYCARVVMGTVNQDSGVDNRSLVKSLARYGFCDERLWPYAIRKFTQRPPAEAFSAASRSKVSSYAVVRQTLDDMRACIASGYPFIFGLTVFPSLEAQTVARTGVVPDPRRGEQPAGGHDVLVCGYDDYKQRFKFRNSWMNGPNKPWGQNGCGFISYKYATNPELAGDFWVLNAYA